MPTSESPRHGALVYLPLVALAWGALAFGAVYPWAYWPLAAMCVITGVMGLLIANRRRVSGTSVALNAALVATAAAVLVQLLPLPNAVVAAVSPHSGPVVGRLNPAFAAGLSTWRSASIWPHDTWIALALYASFAVLLVGATSLFSLMGCRRFVEALTGFGALLAIAGFVQKSWSNRYLYGFWELEPGRTPFGPFVNRNHFAGWMVMVLPLTLALFVAGINQGMRGVRRGWRHKVLWFASPDANRLMLVAGAVVLMSMSLLLTMSRSGITAFALAMAVTGWFVARSVSSRSRRFAAVACVGVLVLIAVLWTGPDVVASRFAAADWGEFNNRKGAWIDALGVAHDFPLVGTGLNTYWAAALFYQRHEMAYFFAQAHNDYMQLAAEGGLLLTVPALVCLAIFARDVRRRTRARARIETAEWLRAGAVASVTAIAFQETVEFSLQMPGNAALFAIVCAIALHQPHEAVDTEHEASAPGPTPLRGEFPRIVPPTRTGALPEGEDRFPLGVTR